MRVGIVFLFLALVASGSFAETVDLTVRSNVQGDLGRS